MLSWGKYAGLVTGLLLAVSATAQNVQQVIAAEKAFAAYARDVNTRDAFLKFMDQDAVVFTNGQAQNAIAVWTKTPASTTKLLWEPAFAGVAASGDLGFTTGPWQFKKSLTDTALAAGQFTSVWRKDAQGDWKNIVDMGYAFGKPSYTVPELRISEPAGASKKSTITEVLVLEKKLIEDYRRQGAAAFKEVLIAGSWLNMHNSKPVIVNGQPVAAIGPIPDNLMMEPVGSGMSGAGDLAYVYGNVIYQQHQENYLRVWQQTQQGWKVILQVLQW